MTPDKPADSQSRTSLTLLERLREKDELAWSHFESFYGPIIFRFCISRGVSHDQAEEVKSQCYEAVVKQIESFTYDERRGRFRNWLLTIAARRIADYLNRKKHVQADTRVLEAIETQDSSPEVLWEKHWRQQILIEASNRVESRMNDESREVFRRLVQRAEPVNLIASELGISTNQVYKTKQRSIQMLREEIQILECDPLTAG